MISAALRVPGGNLTGVSMLAVDPTLRRLECARSWQPAIDPRPAGEVIE